MRLSDVFRRVGWVSVVVFALGCHTDRAAFFKRVFGCDVASKDPGCSKDVDGHEMVCYAGGNQLGASGFCARSCNDGEVPDGDVCLPSARGDDSNLRVALHSCKPSEEDQELSGGACRQAALGCMTTDLRAGYDEGVCTTMTPCSENADCHDPVRPVCASSFLQESLYPHAHEALNLRHLFCLQVGCDKNETACSPGESCLRRVIGTAANPPDICVPNCDSHHRCPPNFLCYQGVSTTIAPNVCIPGILAFTCSNAMDCLLGDCVDTGIGYRVCSPRCTTDAECAAFDGPQGKFVCVQGDGPTHGTCQAADAYRGSICTKDEHCHERNADEKCVFLDPSASTGTCLLPCSGGACPSRGGIGHVCLPGLDACFPGYQELPCQSDSNCVGDLKCLQVAETTSVCTKRCNADADCTPDEKRDNDPNRWLSPSWCHPLLHACLKKLEAGHKDCPGDSACLSGRCQVTIDPDGGTSSKCL